MLQGKVVIFSQSVLDQRVDSTINVSGKQR